MAKEIKLTKGLVAIVDDVVFEWLSQYKWYANKTRNATYARREEIIDGMRVKKYMHREVLGIGKNKVFVVDHIDGNTLNNQKDNLRAVSHRQNLRNQQLQSNTSSKFKGVCFVKASGKWIAGIKINYRRINLGTYSSEEEAAFAYNEAAIKYHGQYARLNPIELF